VLDRFAQVGSLPILKRKEKKKTAGRPAGPNDDDDKHSILAVTASRYPPIVPRPTMDGQPAPRNCTRLLSYLFICFKIGTGVVVGWYCCCPSVAPTHSVTAIACK